jgi:hypothetical protein
VLIKGFDARGIVWYTNYTSRKGRELAANPFAALQFHWVELERVVRIEGRVEKADEDGVRRLLPQPPARLAHRRLGLAAERGDRVARGAGRQRGEVRRDVPAQPAAPAALGRLPAGARPLGVLQGRTSRLHDRCATGRLSSMGARVALRRSARPVVLLLPSTHQERPRCPIFSAFAITRKMAAQHPDRIHSTRCHANGVKVSIMLEEPACRTRRTASASSRRTAFYRNSAR